MSAVALLPLAVFCVGAALVIGWLFSQSRTRPMMTATGRILEFLTNILH